MSIYTQFGIGFQRERYRKSVKPSMFTILYWHFSVKKEIGSFKKKKHASWGACQLFRNADIPCFVISRFCPCRIWSVSVSQLCEVGIAAHPCFLVTVVEYTYQRAGGNIFSYGGYSGIPLMGWPYCIHLKKGLTNIYLGGVDRLPLECTFHSFSKLVPGFTHCAVCCCPGPLVYFFCLFVLIQKIPTTSKVQLRTVPTNSYGSNLQPRNTSFRVFCFLTSLEEMSLRDTKCIPSCKKHAQGCKECFLAGL